MARWHSCIVFDSASHLERRLWQFAAAGKFNLLHEQTASGTEPLPEKLVGKDWPALFQPKLNVAWLPSEQVFFRVIQIHKSDYDETRSMIELQLEKLSPLPPAQVVWSFELLPPGAGELQTAIVTIAARQHVEQFLGRLETQGYLADRLEVPLIDQVLATRVTEDGVWIYPGFSSDQPFCLIAWWYGGILCNLSLLLLPAVEARERILQDHLTQISWAGEIEGWLTAPPKLHLVADEEMAQVWKSLLPGDQPVLLVPPLPSKDLAALTARRAVSEINRLNLLPTEFGSRYRQLFIDRLWMRALAAVLILYVAGVAVYLIWAQAVRLQYTGIEKQVAALGPTYTNVVKLRDEVRILQDQFELQFASLDCWKAIAETLPTDLTLESLSFERGQKLVVAGISPSTAQDQVSTFNEKLQNATVKNRTLFKKIDAPRFTTRGSDVFWSFSAELNRTQTE